MFLKSQNIPSDNAAMLVVISPVSCIAIKSPGSMIVCIWEYTAGSLSFTQASFAAVKLPGEFNKCDKHFSCPIVLKAFSP